MAWQTIGNYVVYDFEQEEIKETKQVAGEDGVVQEVTTIIQQYAHFWADLEVQQEVLVAENKSNFLANLYFNIEIGEGEPVTFKVNPGASNYPLTHLRFTENGYYNDSYSQPINEYKEFALQPGESVIKKHIARFNSSGDVRNSLSNDKGTIHAFHDLNGILSSVDLSSGYGYSSGNYTIHVSSNDFYFSGGVEFTVTNLIVDGQSSKSKNYKGYFSEKPTILANDRAIYATTATNFTDEENPVFTYTTTTGTSRCMTTKQGVKYINDEITSLKLALSLDGETIDIDYREIPVDGTSYTFNLSDAERDLLRQRAQGSDTVPIYYMTKVVRELPSASYYDAQSALIVGKTQRYLTIVGCNPILNPTVKDIKEETLALTGDENTFIRYESMAEFAINATASKHAEIVSQSVTCGSKTIEGLPYGVIDDVESGTFNFYVTDSRNMGAASAVFKNLVEYVKPTCYQKVEVAISGETGANIKVKANGSYFNGSFGAADNTLLLEVRHTDDNGDMGEWKALSGTPTFNGNTYELEATLSGFNYGKAYVFQCRATDKLNVVQSSQYTIRMLPVFDWSETDFNFNVPINIDADNLDMHGETVLRHNEAANNTVLSATGGNIYIRPGGTDNTYNQTILYGNGNVEFSGDATFGGGATFNDTVTFNNSFSLAGFVLDDYVIETGEEAMGSNGTWYWRKWKSGKSEAWGCRNFGNMAVTTAWGNLYRSAIFTQDLPEDVFIRTPDSININIVHGGYGGWICKHEQTAPSAITTGSFIWVRPASATVSPTNIGFYVIGEWK